jgi:hypothetical protein
MFALGNRRRYGRFMTGCSVLTANAAAPSYFARHWRSNAQHPLPRTVVPAPRSDRPSAYQRGRESAAPSKAPACITTGTGITIRRWGGIHSPIRWGSSMDRVCMRMLGTTLLSCWTSRDCSQVRVAADRAEVEISAHLSHRRLETARQSATANCKI